MYPCFLRGLEGVKNVVKSGLFTVNKRQFSSVHYQSAVDAIRSRDVLKLQ